MPPLNSQRTAFIPKKPIAEMGRHRPLSSSSVNFLMIIAVTMIIISMLLAGGTFAWRKYLESSIKKAESFIKQNEAQFDVTLLNSIARLNDRIINSKIILDNHLAPSKIFDYIAGVTLSSVRFADFNFVYNDDGSIKISMKGEAKNFPSIALQSKVFEKIEDIKNPIMTNFSLGERGEVKFDFSATVPKETVIYSSNQ